MNLELIRKQAEDELAAERHREAVDSYKLKIKNRKSLLDKIFPYRVVLIKKGE